MIINKLTINNNSNNKDTDILNSKINSRSIKPQTTNISDISHTVADNSSLVFNVVRDIALDVLTPLTAALNGFY